MRRIRRKREMDDYFSSEDEFAFSFRKVTAIAFEERGEVEIFHRIFVSWLALGSPIWRRFFFLLFSTRHAQALLFLVWFRCRE